MTTIEEKQFIKDRFKNLWFHSTYLWDEAIPELVTEGFFKPLTDIVNHPKAKRWYVPCHFTVDNLSEVFSLWALHEFELYQFGYNYEI